MINKVIQNFVFIFALTCFSILSLAEVAFAVTLEGQRNKSEEAVSFAKKGKCLLYSKSLSDIKSNAVRDATILISAILKSSCVNIMDVINILDYKKETGVDITMIIEDIIPFFLSKSLDLGKDDSERIFLFAEDLMDNFESFSTSALITIVDLLKQTGGSLKKYHINSLDDKNKVRYDRVIKRHVNKVWGSRSFTVKQWHNFFQKNKFYINEVNHFLNLQGMLLSGHDEVLDATMRHFNDQSMKKMLLDGISVKHAIRKEEVMHIISKNRNSYFISLMALVHRKDLLLEERYHLIESISKDSFVIPSLFYKNVAYIIRSCIGIVVKKKALSSLLNKVTGLHGDEEVDKNILAGWLSLRIDNDPEVAISHLRKIDVNNLQPHIKSRVNYWLGRSFDSIRNNNLARHYYGLASQNVFSFYGQIAIEELGATPKIEVHKKLRKLISEEKKCSKLYTNLVLELGRLMEKYTNVWRSIAYLERGAIGISKNGIYDVCYSKNIILSSNQKFRNYLGIRMADLNMPILPYSYPSSEHSGIPLINAIIRQEGSFHFVSKSNKNAIGLMQILRGTGEGITKSCGKKFDASMLWDERYNIALGQFFLKELHSKYNDLPVFIAAYNAGPGRVKSWINRVGDPMHNKYKIIDWIEVIPYRETRNYTLGATAAKVVYDAIAIEKSKKEISKLILNINSLLE